MFKRVVIIFFLLIVLINGSPIIAQQIDERHYGINGGVVIAFGNRFDRIGINVNTYFRNDHFQLNPELRVYFNFKNLGPKKQYLETVASLGIVYGYGKKQIGDTNYFYSSVSNQTSYSNSFGYSFNLYFNSIETSQQTGIISFQVDAISFVAENDLFARPKLDRFRTGAFLLQYRQGKSQLGINSTLFTGLMGNKIKDERYPYSHLYKDTTGGKYTQYSHGLLSAQFQYILPYYQKVQASIGIDSERVRHTVQNRLIHDMIFLPKKWRKKNAAHVPMLDIKNGQYLYRENQKVKAPSFYYNLFSNPGIFY